MKITKKTISTALAACLLAMGFAGCNDDNDYSLGDIYLSIATVDNPEESNHFFFTLDNGLRMWTAATAYYNYRPKTGQRILANYTILSDTDSGSSYDHNVRLNDVYSILTKDIVSLTDENEDEIGDDPYRTVKMWISGDWLNVEFTIDAYNKSHYINLCRDERSVQSTPDDTAVPLLLRQNANGDAAVRPMWGMASFNLSSYRETGKDEVKFRVQANVSGDSNPRTFDLTYNYADPENPDVKIDMDGEEHADIE